MELCDYKLVKRMTLYWSW